MDYTTIKIGEGIGNIKFWMTREQVKQTLGKPDEIEANAFEEEDGQSFVTESWHYDELEISIAFDEAEEWRLIAIATSDEKATIEGEELVGLSQVQLTKKLDKLQLGTWQHEKFGDNYELIRVEDKELNFWIDEGEVSEIQFSPMYDNKLFDYSLN